MKLVEKLDITYDPAKLWNDCISIISTYGWGKVGQICLNHRDITTDPETRVFEGVGSLRDTGFKEGDFNTLNDMLRETYLETVLSWLPYKIGRFRLMRMAPRSCYSVHRDASMRVHLPLITNNQAFLIFPNHSLVSHLPADGAVYLTNTTVMHTAMNGGLDYRFHLVGALVE